MIEPCGIIGGGILTKSLSPIKNMYKVVLENIIIFWNVLFIGEKKQMTYICNI